MKPDDPDEAPGGDEDPRLTSLEERLKAAHHAETERTAPARVPNVFGGKGASQGNRVISALIGMPFGAGVIGFALDRFFGTQPKAMFAMLFLGTVAAFVQIWRISRERAE